MRVWTYLFIGLLLVSVVSAASPDVNSDGTVNLFDLVLVASNIGTNNVQYDVTGDGIINLFDLVGVVNTINNPETTECTLDADCASGEKCTAGVCEIVYPVPGGSDAYLSDVAWVSATNDWGPVERDTSNGKDSAGDGTTITLNGVTYTKGLGVHANSEIVYDLGGKYNTFFADVGIDDEKDAGSVVFQVWGDNNKLYGSGVMGPTTPTKKVIVNVEGVNMLKLVVTDAGDNFNSDHADWAGARISNEVIEPPPTICSCDSWTGTTCGVGSCTDNELQQTRSCIPDACKVETRCVASSACEQPPTSTDGTQWEPLEITMSSSNILDWKSFPVQVTFTHSSGTKHVLDGYWDGGKNWKVRFAASKPGLWTWTSSSTDSGLNGKSGSLNIAAPTNVQKNNNPNYKGHLTISNNNRYLEYQDGTPFFYLADTNWMAFTCRTGLSNSGICENDVFYEWVDDRNSKQFTVAMVRYINPWLSNEGGCPYTTHNGCDNPNKPDNGDWSGINHNFFKSIDTRMKTLWDEGFVVAGHPDWIRERSMDLSDAKAISRYMFSRYGAYNIVWGITGEYNGKATTEYWKKNDYENFNTLGYFIKTINDKAYKHPLTVHPGWTFSLGNPIDPMKGSSSPSFHNEDWLDLNWVQTWHDPRMIAYLIDQDYNLKPTKPVLMSEPWYENAYQPYWEYTADAKTMRHAAYTSMLHGSLGFTYGAYRIWQMTDPSELGLPGSDDMRWVKKLFTSVNWWKLVPDCVLINGNTPDLLNTNHPSCAKNTNEAVAYIPGGLGGSTIKVTDLGTKQYEARWFNPRNGAFTSIGTITPSNSKWTVPNRPNNSDDWVIVLE